MEKLAGKTGGFVLGTDKGNGKGPFKELRKQVTEGEGVRMQKQKDGEAHPEHDNQDRAGKLMEEPPPPLAPLFSEGNSN